MARGLKRLWGLNKKGEKDSIIGTSLPDGWKNLDAPKEAKKRGPKSKAEADE